MYIPNLEFFILITKLNRRLHVSSCNKSFPLSPNYYDIMDINNSHMKEFLPPGRLSEKVCRVGTYRVKDTYLGTFRTFFRVSRLEVFCRKGVLRNFAKIYRKSSVPELLF